LEAEQRGAGLFIPCPDCGRTLEVPGRSQETRRIRVRYGGLAVPTTHPAVHITFVPALIWSRRLTRIGAWLCFLSGMMMLGLPSMKPAYGSLLFISAVLGAISLAHRKANLARLVLPAIMAAAPILIYGLTTEWKSWAPKLQAVLIESVEEVPLIPPALPRMRAAPPVKPVEAPKPVSSPQPTMELIPALVTKATGVIEVASVSLPPLSPPRPAVAAIRADVAKPGTLPFRLYTDYEDAEPYSASGWMGNADGIEQNECCSEKPHSGKTCIKVTYSGHGKWAGVVWQDPPNNWGETPGGYNLNGAKRLTFWARGAIGTEVVEFKLGLVGYGKKYRDSAKATTGRVHLGTTWGQYAINLKGKDLDRVMTPFAWFVEGRSSPITFYLDDIQYE